MGKYLLLLLLTIVSCAKTEKTEALNLTDYTWDQIIEQSRGKEVTLYMWGGSEVFNDNIDTVIIPRLKELNDITLVRVPVSDTKDIANKLIVEKKAGKKVGSVDIIWINGENFKLLKEADALFGPFSQALPNIALINDSMLEFDFGTPIEGMESPWGIAQFNFIDKGQGAIPFTSADTLLEYVKANPGRFTYPSIPDFHGSAFVRNIAIEILGYSNILEMSNEELVEELTNVWNYLAELKPYLWKNGETYPENLGKMELLFNNGSIDIMMNYSINFVSQKILSGEYPKTSRSFLFDKGTLFNNNYMGIAWNAPQVFASLYVLNYFLSEELQLKRLDPNTWSEPSILDLEKIDPATKQRILEMSEVSGGIPILERTSKALNELSADKALLIDDEWLKKFAY